VQGEDKTHFVLSGRREAMVNNSEIAKKFRYECVSMVQYSKALSFRWLPGLGPCNALTRVFGPNSCWRLCRLGMQGNNSGQGQVKKMWLVTSGCIIDSIHKSKVGVSFVSQISKFFASQDTFCIRKIQRQ
jgi:hypothetical protein